MATYNNKHWLLSHIRTSFMSTDDTGISELVMNSEDLAKNLAQTYNRQPTKSSSPVSGSDNHIEEIFCNIYPGLENAEDEEDFSQSFDINFAQEGPFYRYRTNTDAKMDKMQDIKRKQQSVKTVKCDDAMVRFNSEAQDDNELFVRKDMKKVNQETPKASKLALQLETLPPIAVNKYRTYSCHDGTSHPSNEVRTIQVFIVNFPQGHREYPIRCCVQATAKVEEFIGFLLFKCCQDYAEATSKTSFGDVKEYGLYITDETGEPDLDFPALDAGEQIQRFQFSHLALAERSQPPQNRTLSVVSETAVTARQPFKEAEKSQQAILRMEENAMNHHDAFIEAPIYRAYRVHFITKKHFRTEVQLGISGDIIEMDPLQQKTSNYFFKPVKPIHYAMDSVASCEVTSRKTNRCEFKIAYNPMFFEPSVSFGPSTSLHEPTMPTSFTLKIHTFETDRSTAEEIVMKVNNILVLRTSTVRQEYLNRHEKSKKSFIKKKKFPI